MKLRIKSRGQNYFFESVKEVITIGRSSENDFSVPSDDLSRKHCQITVKGNYFFLMDLGSKNGVTVDGERISPHKQVSIYPSTRIVLANSLDLYLEDAQTDIRKLLPDAEEFEIDLETFKKK